MFKKLFSRSSSAPAAAQATVAEPVPAEPVQAAVVRRSTVPDLTRKAAHSLSKFDLTAQRAAVYLVMDRSGSMRKHYDDGTMQYLGEQVLGLSRALDDDGSVPVFFFSTGLDGETVVSVDDYAGRIQAAHEAIGHMGRTYYERGINAAVAHYRASGATAPALVVFQSDGRPNNPAAAVEAFQEAEESMFFALVGYGDKVDFMRGLPAQLRNVGFFHAADPANTSDEELYDGIVSPFRTFLAARSAGAR
ncbi:VWA domain-containing protein (plasmid) [Streptomyces sp. NBC_00637]|uniref:VWA domain-containing protein n=1 Tax=Streptomyces sp. NBC_00637 TaxID=2903667 RepID=UPI002F914565